MTRLRTDQACLEAQMQQQIAQGLNAELAVPCPDCGVESGRACRDSLDRAVRTHLARSVAANRRDTEPCPAPAEDTVLARAEDLEPKRSICACGQTVWNGLTVANVPTCSDCAEEQNRAAMFIRPAPLDQRIREAQPDDAPECAWSTPTSEGEGWR